MTFGEAIWEPMMNKGVSVTDLAKATGIEYAKINQYCREGKMPCEEDRDKICDVLGLDKDNLPLFDTNLNMTVTETARCMNRSNQFVKDAIDNGTLPGCRDSKGNYHIPRKRWNIYMGITQEVDIQEIVGQVCGAIKYMLLEENKKMRSSCKTKRIDSSS